MRKAIWILLCVAYCHFAGSTYAQTVREIAAFGKTPRKVASLSPDEYALFAADGEQEAYDRIFRKLMTPDVVKLQRETPSQKDSTQMLVCQQCAMPYVQLDTTTMIKYKRELLGYWRAISMSRIRYIDSTSYPDGSTYRDAIVLNEEPDDDMIMAINDKSFRAYHKVAGSEKYRIIIDSKYELQGKRFLLLYKNLKRAADVSITGIDKDGNLIVNAYTAIQRRIPNNYTVHETIVEQLVLEKLKVEQLRYDKDKKPMQGTGRHVAPN